MIAHYLMSRLSQSPQILFAQIHHSSLHSFKTWLHLSTLQPPPHGEDSLLEKCFRDLLDLVTLLPSRRHQCFPYTSLLAKTPTSCPRPASVLKAKKQCPGLNLQCPHWHVLLVVFAASAIAADTHQSHHENWWNREGRETL